METEALLREIIKSASDLKALDVTEIDVEGRSSLTERVVLCTGTSTAHTKGIADKIEISLKKKQEYSLGVEGYDTGEWILMDYNSVIIHIFVEETRQRYRLEELYQ